MAQYPALPLFTDAYIADTRHLTATQYGVYLLLLMTAWRFHRNILSSTQPRVFDYLLIGRNISPDLYYSVEQWCNDSDIGFARAWYTLFDYRFDAPISFNYHQPQQRLVEESTYEEDYL